MYTGPACGREPWGYPSCVQPRRAMRQSHASDIVANACKCVCVRKLCSFEYEKKYTGPACGREPWGYPSCVQPRRAMIQPVYTPTVIVNDCVCVCMGGRNLFLFRVRKAIDRPSVREGALGLPKLLAATQGWDQLHKRQVTTVTVSDKCLGCEFRVEMFHIGIYIYM
jgi:hypothetical protein